MNSTGEASALPFYYTGILPVVILGMVLAVLICMAVRSWWRRDASQKIAVMLGSAFLAAYLLLIILTGSAWMTFALLPAGILIIYGLLPTRVINDAKQALESRPERPTR